GTGRSFWTCSEADRPTQWQLVEPALALERAWFSAGTNCKCKRDGMDDRDKPARAAERPTRRHSSDNQHYAVLQVAKLGLGAPALAGHRFESAAGGLEVGEYAAAAS